MSEFLPSVHGPLYNAHQERIILCKVPKKRQLPTLHKCVQCGARITSRNWRSRKPENQVELCDHHVRQKISINREAGKQIC